MEECIRVRNATQHNLKGIDLDIPHRSFTVVTGPSGSGKSSLVFDTIFAEAQRRYVESLSTYAKQFLERMERPSVESVEGVSPAVAIQQKNPTKTSRSTVGTATEIHDYLRLLWARVGRTFCPDCGREIKPDTVQGSVDRVRKLPKGSRVQITFPLPLSSEVTDELIVENLRTLGFIRIIADGREIYLGEATEAAAEPASAPRLTAANELLVVVDRLRGGSASRSRLADSLGTAFAEGEGEAVVLAAGDDGVEERLAFTEQFRCPGCSLTFPEPVPTLFSFNSPMGACPTCNGFGATLEFDLDLIIPDPERSLEDGAVDPWTKPRYEDRRYDLRELARKHKVSVRKPFNQLPERFRRIVLHGEAGFEGVLQQLERLRRTKKYKQYIRVFVRQYQTAQTCRACGGTRLRPEALNVKIAGRTIADIGLLPVEVLRGWVENLKLTKHETAIADTILRELRSRVTFLDEVGLGYLTLDRQARTLSGGESQRINLANSLGSALVDVTYVLDEPSIGLHPRDTARLYQLLEELRGLGNTVLVVEHDPAAIERADHVIELGPASGEHGGALVYEGDLEGLLSSETLTGAYLSGRERIPTRKRRRSVDGQHLILEGARLHNLEGVDVHIPLGVLTVVTGVSGSGKSTLVHDILFRALERKIEGQTSAKQHLGEPVGTYRALRGSGALSAVVLIDQSPIGRTPRSNAVTYLKAYAEIRRIFADLPEARRRKFGPGHFSFNVGGGRCEECEGAGQIEVEMLFLADVYVPCELCGGRRFKPEVLEVRYRGRNIDDILNMSVDEAIQFFIKEDKLGEMLWQLQRVGLGYLRLGQPATTLSGGEAQRLKLARELASASRRAGHKLYLLDEPTTGLHLHDVRKLLQVLDELIEAGHSVMVIEHNLEVIKQADWIVDLGPGAGVHGGQVVAMGRPEAVTANKSSHTGYFLKSVLEGTS